MAMNSNKNSKSNEEILETIRNSILDTIELYKYEFKETHNEKNLRKYAESCAEVYFMNIVSELYKGNIKLEEANDKHSILAFTIVGGKEHDTVVVATHYTYDYQYGYGYEHIHSKVIETTRNIKTVSIDIDVEKKDDGYAE